MHTSVEAESRTGHYTASAIVHGIPVLQHVLYLHQGADGVFPVSPGQSQRALSLRLAHNK